MSQKITIIGTGNVAWHLALELERAGHLVNEIYARSEQKGLEISQNLNNPVITESLDFSQSASRLFIIAVSDNAIESIASGITLPADALLVHTSGTMPLSILTLADHDRTGVFYPLQTLSRNRQIQFSEVPLLIEAGDADTLQQLQKIARTISSNVVVLKSEDRMGIHLASVFANNFTNHMIDIAGQVMNRNALDVKLLEPLIRETVEKVFDHNPSAIQTGPAIRGDTDTIDRHLAYLDFNPRYQQLYQLISASISSNKTEKQHED